ncbi:MAG TPA: hypothetical protein PLR99_32240 [Polyangiaceae bacterium]|nr:hypothetical protein [Polyangiaceae bacterium]
MNDEARDPSDDTNAPTEAPGEAEDAGEPGTADATSEPRVAAAPAVSAPAADAGSAEALFEALWAKVLASWDDDKPHAAILEYALRTERLPDLAGRYRAQKDVEGHEARAQKRLDAIVAAATQLLFAQRAPKPEKAPWQLTVGVGLVCVVVLVWLAFKVLR